MSVTVLPVRDPNLPEYRTRPSPAPLSPGPRGNYDGMQSAPVEILRTPTKRPGAPIAQAAAPAGAQPASAAAPADAPPDAPTPAEAKAAQAAEIELPNGRIVRVPPGFSSNDLERVLAIAASDDPPRSPP